MRAAVQLMACDESIELADLGLEIPGLLRVDEVHAPARDLESSSPGRAGLKNKRPGGKLPLEVLQTRTLRYAVLLEQRKQCARSAPEQAVAIHSVR